MNAQSSRHARPWMGAAAASLSLALVVPPGIAAEAECHYWDEDICHPPVAVAENANPSLYEAEHDATIVANGAMLANAHAVFDYADVLQAAERPEGGAAIAELPAVVRPEPGVRDPAAAQEREHQALVDAGALAEPEVEPPLDERGRLIPVAFERLPTIEPVVVDDDDYHDE
jgi:hypothetical protein